MVHGRGPEMKVEYLACTSSSHLPKLWADGSVPFIPWRLLHTYFFVA